MQGVYHQAIFGDLNTMAHGIARFSPKYCQDKMRFWSIGQSEGEFWDRVVFQIMDPDTIPEQDNPSQQRGSPDVAQQASGDQQTGMCAHAAVAALSLVHAWHRCKRRKLSLVPFMPAICWTDQAMSASEM